MTSLPALLVTSVLLLTGWCGARGAASDAEDDRQGAGVVLQGLPLRAQLAGDDDLHGKLSLFVPRGQEELAANEWQDYWTDRAAVVVRQANQNDALLDDEEGAVNDDDVDDDDEEAAAPMSPSWLRSAVDAGVRRGATQREHANDVDGSAPGRLRRKRSASPGPNEASGEDASVASTMSKRLPQQAKARGHQFITARNEKAPPPVVREVDTEKPPVTAVGTSPATPPATPTHATPVAAGSSRIGAGRDADRDSVGRDALGLRANEIPQGPRYTSTYESETTRHAADHRHYTADSYGSHNSYSASYGGGYGSPAGAHAAHGGGYGGGYGGAYSGYPRPGVPVAPRNAALLGPPGGPPGVPPTATPRRIIYYASLPEPTPQPGASRVPHEYRGPPFDVNGAYSSDIRYPPANDNMYRYTIIDAEPPGPVLSGYHHHHHRPPASVAAAPYRVAPAPAAFPHPYRINPPQPTDSLPVGPAGPAGAGAAGGPQNATPIQYTQYDYNGIGARTSASALIDAKQGPGLPGLPSGVPLSDDPYRGFNPRQPAPWSMQVGTRLTVKDDGYGSSAGLPSAARRFYVTSQQQPGLGGPPLGEARFPRPLDRSRFEARNRLYR